ncbi:MAG: hypothetical protein LBR66_08950 [Candidatus Symbiothrix sp.]|jgi:hypothetical protein|nr:hypothetical protein [Candidatus Symbiothrix sp.]
MANEIVKLVAKKAGISESVAQIAVDTVLNLLKEKLPDNVSGYLDILAGSSATTAKTKGKKKVSSKTKTNPDPLSGLSSIIGGLGSLLGGKK